MRLFVWSIVSTVAVFAMVGDTLPDYWQPEPIWAALSRADLVRKADRIVRCDTLQGLAWMMAVSEMTLRDPWIWQLVAEDAATLRDQSTLPNWYLTRDLTRLACSVQYGHQGLTSLTALTCAAKRLCRPTAASCSVTTIEREPLDYHYPESIMTAEELYVRQDAEWLDVLLRVLERRRATFTAPSDVDLGLVRGGTNKEWLEPKWRDRAISMLSDGWVPRVLEDDIARGYAPAASDPFLATAFRITYLQNVVANNSWLVALRTYESTHWCDTDWFIARDIVRAICRQGSLGSHATEATICAAKYLCSRKPSVLILCPTTADANTISDDDFRRFLFSSDSAYP